MILIHQNTKNLKSISSLSSNPLLSRIDNSFLNTTCGSMASLSNQFNVATVNPFPKILSVPSAVHLIISFMTTMVVTVSINAKSVVRPSLPAKWLQHLSGLLAPIAQILSLPRKAASSSVYINVSIPNVLAISTT